MDAFPQCLNKLQTIPSMSQAQVISSTLAHLKNQNQTLPFSFHPAEQSSHSWGDETDSPTQHLELRLRFCADTSQVIDSFPHLFQTTIPQAGCLLDVTAQTSCTHIKTRFQNQVSPLSSHKSTSSYLPQRDALTGVHHCPHHCQDLQALLWIIS